MIVEEYLAPPPGDIATGLPVVFGISARDSNALNVLRKLVIEWIQDPKHVDESLYNIAYTSTARRRLYEHRLAVSINSKEELAEKLEKASVIQVKDSPFTAAFVFSGQGSQSLGMGQSLYRTSPLFRKVIDDCHSILITAGFPGVLPIIAAEGNSSGLTKLEEFEANQAAIFSLEYALAKMWISWGITPNVVVGHRYSLSPNLLVITI